MRVKLFLFTALIAGALISGGCAFVLRPQHAAVTRANQPPSKTTRFVEKAITDYEDRILEKYQVEDFASISAEAASLRISKERLHGGYWKLRALYDAIEQPQANDHSDDAWQKIFAKLGRWRAQQPQDVTPVIALASAWREYAWRARGDGYADTVSATGWELYHSRIDKAGQILSEARNFNQKCPELYHEALRMGSDEWDRATLDEFFAEGTALEPTYYYLHQQKAMTLLPRWGGREGEWEQFADQAASKIGGQQGDIVFFNIYSLMKDMHNINFMPFHQQAAPRLIAGFRAIEKLYGASSDELNKACMASLFIKDPKTTAELLARTEKDLDTDMWEGRQRFETLRDGFWLQQKALGSPNNGSAATRR
jgi:hypothetical protein